MLKTFERIAASIPLADLAAHVGASLEDGGTLEITGVAPIEEAGPTDVSFVGNDAYLDKAKDSRAGALLVDQTFKGEAPMPLLRVPNPRLAYAQVLERFFAPVRPAGAVHATAIVPASCRVDPSASIGPYVVLGENVEVGPGTVVHPHVVVYDDAVLGSDCVVHSGAVIREAVRLGDRVVVQNGAIVGSDGFGYAPTAEGRWHKIPQVGDVEVGDDVEIQAATCIDRAAVGTTTIGRGTKLDNLVQVGHGCHVGEDTLLCGQVGLAGSTDVGDHCMLGGQVGVAGHLTIHDGVSVAAQSGVMSDLEEGKTYMGSPALEGRHARTTYLLFTRLPDLAKRIKALERAQAQGS